MGQALPVTPVQHWAGWRWGREAVVCSRQGSRAPGWIFPGHFGTQDAASPWESGRAQTSLALLRGKETKPFFQDSWGKFWEKIPPLEQLCFLQEDPKIQPEDFPAWRAWNMRGFSSRLFVRGAVWSLFYFLKAELVLALPAQELVLLKDKELSSQFPSSPGTGNSQVLPKGAPSPGTNPSPAPRVVQGEETLYFRFILFFPPPAPNS